MRKKLYEEEEPDEEKEEEITRETIKNKKYGDEPMPEFRLKEDAKNIKEDDFFD